MRRAGRQFDRRRGACEGKEKFGSYTVAAEVAERRKRGGTKNHVYRCAECHAFHLGSKGVGGRSRRPDQVELEEQA